VLRDERHGWNTRELANQVTDAFDLLRPAAMYRDQDSIYRPLPNDPYSLRDRVAVHERKAAAARGIHPGTLERQ
jgi:hypothetical protein